MIESAQVESPVAEAPVAEPERKAEGDLAAGLAGCIPWVGDGPDAGGSDALAGGGASVSAQHIVGVGSASIPSTWTGKGARCMT